MNNKPMAVVQCWDDGVATDARLVEIFRRHGAKATFNLNAGRHDRARRLDWVYRGSEVWKLGTDEMPEVYSGFPIANHGLTHLRLDGLDRAVACREIGEGRERLEQLFARPVVGFAYPYGAYDEAAMSILRETGHRYARTVGSATRPFPPADPMALHPCCHFLAPDFRARYEAARDGGVFYFWGHSYELVGAAMWADFEAAIARMSEDPLARWFDVAELFADPAGKSI